MDMTKPMPLTRLETAQVVPMCVKTMEATCHDKWSNLID